MIMPVNSVPNGVGSVSPPMALSFSGWSVSRRLIPLPMSPAPSA